MSKYTMNTILVTIAAVSAVINMFGGGLLFAGLAVVSMLIFMHLNKEEQN